MKARKKPVVVDAEQWFPGKQVDGVTEQVYEENGVVESYGYGMITTLEGPLRVSPGDWIITGVQGEKYPCKPSVFDETYELLDDQR